uniref:diacylglycerol O-acyltransferase n=1 Tax=Macrostomum lignano TaxID=282301 RepID=A0A1I8J5H1_9PLAT
MDLQTWKKFAVLQWVLTFLLVGPGCAAIMLILFRTSWWSAVLLYGVWYYYDRDTPRRGGRRVNWVRRWGLWRRMAEYFPVKLHPTCELDPKENYVLGYHPHGVLSTGAFLNFATEATEFSRKFPGITPYLSVLDGHFDFPLYREYFMCSGVISVRKRRRKTAGGQLVCVIPGGAVEALDSHPGTVYRVHLRNKLGFVRLAMQTGSSLVPCFSFGEIDLFNQPAARCGRGHGLLPFAKPINTVVGAPIKVEKNYEPTDEQARDLLNRYISDLELLFCANKAKYIGTDARLEIV